MKIYKGIECILPCCFDMKIQFDKDVNFFEESDPDKMGEIIPHFFYDSVCNEVNFPLLEKGFLHETTTPYYSFSYLTVHYCPFCGAKIEVID